ncbi:MAG: hypothetical protein IMZ61_03560 [Planctomycetes bacterium]|nr:hypothetical protein [Planctomycetota bacterium]
MKYDFTPEEAIPNAEVVRSHFSKRSMKVVLERSPWPSAPYSTTVYAKKGSLYILVEAQSVFNYTRNLRELAAWLSKSRCYAELYIAVGIEATLKVSALNELRVDGVGLLTIDGEGSLTTSERAKNHALIMTPEPTLKLGKYGAEVRAATEKFNTANRKDALRDMCELVERMTDELGARACTKAWLKIPAAEFAKKNWESQINELARPEAYNTPHSPLIDTNLKNDLLSFKGARNLVSHKSTSSIAAQTKERQFAERMMQGPRIINDLLKAYVHVR